ncbi:hypothetical protein [Albibacterium profundi]|uniref:Uncharacterized protein n=1 Tax=Albibacterium profundi TaxID=3134906 RepID=A0ABV5CHH6_9SPHI
MKDNQNSSKETSYLPISWDDMELLYTLIKNKKEGKVFFFGKDGQLDETKGHITAIHDEKKDGVYAIMSGGDKVRVDRIITIFGQVGAAYDEYEAFGNACMVCK